MGDLNVALEEIDVSHPVQMKLRAGFSTEERDNLRKLLSSGWCDIWRKTHPLAREYSWVGNCDNNTDHGMRLANFLITPNLIDKCRGAYTLPHIKGSDHIPIGIDLE